MITSITEFWNTHHNLTLSRYGFEIDNPTHFSFVGRREDNSIHSVIILIPFKDIAHHAHICSEYKSKTLFSFIIKSLRLMKANKNIGVVICETQGKPEFRAGDRLAEAFGFTPVKTGFGWTDYIWDTKL